MPVADDFYDQVKTRPKATVRLGLLVSVMTRAFGDYGYSTSKEVRKYYRQMWIVYVRTLVVTVQMMWTVNKTEPRKNECIIII